MSIIIALPTEAKARTMDVHVETTLKSAVRAEPSDNLLEEPKKISVKGRSNRHVVRGTPLVIPVAVEVFDNINLRGEVVWEAGTGDRHGGRGAQIATAVSDRSLPIGEVVEGGRLSVPVKVTRHLCGIIRNRSRPISPA